MLGDIQRYLFESVIMKSGYIQPSVMTISLLPYKRIMKYYIYAILWLMFR